MMVPPWEGRMHLLASIRRRYLLYLTLLVAPMFVFILFGERGLMHLYRLRQEQSRIQMENARLQMENQKLAEQIQRMRQNRQEEVERIARQELGLVKKGEIVYHFEK